MAGQKRYSRKAITEAIKGSRGIKTAICARLTCSRQTLDNYLARYPELVALVENERESIIDLAETKLLKALQGDDMRAILFVLETMGKGRGWSKRTEVTGADGAPLGLPPDVLDMMRKMGVTPEEMVQQIAELMRAEAAVGGG
jgi:hypothetical protein